ncbi:MAG: helix-turn-helix domain-containing protein [Candidatus Delongbacteria bacterium]|jgi:AraC-like DNA-binding protein|nr:helix-turn-helix domain-containing protein [Candidatus Delongbacteria bacterium]
MFNQLNDEEFCKEVHRILLENRSKEFDIKKILSDYFGKSFSYIHQRYRRLDRKTIFSAHEELMLEYAMVNLKKSFCIDVMIDLGFKNESYFAAWFRKHTGLNPSEYKKSVE